MRKWYNKRTVTIGVIDARFLMTRQGDGPQIGRWRGRWRSVLTCVGGPDHAGRTTAAVVAPQQLKMIFVTESYHQIDIVLDAGVQVWYRCLLKKSYLKRHFYNIVIIIQSKSFNMSLRLCNNFVKEQKIWKGYFYFIFFLFFHFQEHENIYKIIITRRFKDLDSGRWEEVSRRGLGNWRGIKFIQ